jgi:glycosyltransferase involved in cell wall biosynthesis
VISCLRGAGVEVAEVHVPVWEDRRHKFDVGPTSALRLLLAQTELGRLPKSDADAVIVGYPGHLDLGRARRLRLPIVFNPLVSLWDTFVNDRGRFKPGGLRARALRAIDRNAFRAADLVVSDTDAHAELFHSLDARRVETCFVGAEERIFRPGWSPTALSQALFVGKLIPLHGLETILAAARLAPDIRFLVAGSGQLDRLLEDRPPNVEHVSWVEYEQLPSELHRASCALGIFGTSEKAQRVIPNKVFQALACGTPVVTADTPAARELLRDGESALLVPSGDPAALVDAIRRVTPAIGEGGLAAYQAHASEKVLGARWRGLIESGL